MNLKALAALLFTVVIWGIAPALVRGFSLAAGPWDSMFIRLVSVALICLCLLPISGWRVERKDWARFLLISWAGTFLYFVGSIFGFAHIGAGPGGLIMATQPLIVAVMAAMIGAERIGLSTVAGFIVSFVGSLYLFGGDLQLTGSNPLLGAVEIVGCCIAFAIQIVFAKPLVQSYGPLRVTVINMILTAIPAFFFYRPEVWGIVAGLDWRAWASLFYLGPVGTIVAVVTWNYALGQLRPTTIGGSLYAIPLLSIVAGWALLGEPLSSQTFVAAAIILGGVAIAEYGKSTTMSAAAPAALTGVAAIIFAVVCWGTIPVAMRYLLLEVSPETALFLRLFPAGVAAALIAVWIGAPRLTWGEWTRIAIAGGAGYLSYHVLAAYGIKLIPASWTGLLFGLEPIFIALAAMIFLGERLNTWFVAGLAAALLGTGILVFGSSTGTLKDVSMLGVVLVAISTVGWAIYSTLIRPISNRHGATITACLAVAMIALPIPAFLSPQSVQEIQSISGGHWLAVIHVSVIATTLATIAWNFSLKTMSNARAGMFLYAQPIIATIGGILFLNEELSVWLLSGGALILLGVALSQLGQTRTQNRNAAADEDWPYADGAEAVVSRR